MKTTNSFNILFFLKKDKASKGIAPLYVRITINKKFVDISLKRRLKLVTWDHKFQKVIGADKELKEVQEKVRQTRTEINSAYDNLRYNKEVLTADSIKTFLESGGEEEQTTLLFLMNYHNTEVKMYIMEMLTTLFRAKLTTGLADFWVAANAIKACTKIVI